MNGSVQESLVELEYFLEEIYKATTDQQDWNNPKGQQYPHDLRKPLPLIPNSRGFFSNPNSTIAEIDRSSCWYFHEFFQRFEETNKTSNSCRDWNKTFPAKHGLVQPWISTLAWNEDPHESFNEMMDTPLDFSAFVLNQLKVYTLTPELLAGPTFELIKGSCKSLVELKYFLEVVYKATTDQLDWINPEGQQYPHDLRKPLPLIPNSQGRRVIPFDHFINNDLAYLSGGVSSQTYATSVTKTKAADYEHIKWIEDLVLNTMWSQVPIVYNKHALWGISHWGRKRQQLYGFVVNRKSTHDVYSRHRILAITKLKIFEWHNSKHLEWITVRRDDDKLYTFKEGDYNRLHLQDIEDMLLLLVQGKLTNLNIKERLALGVSLSKSENKGIVPTEMKLILEQTQQGISYEVLVSAEGFEERKRNVRIKGEKKEAIHTLRQKPDSILQAGNPVKEILLKLNLPDHRILKDGGEDYDHGSFESFPLYEAKHRLKIHFHVEKRLGFLRGVGRKELGGKNRLMKAVQSSSHVSIVPSLSSSNHVFASPVSDRGNIIRRTTSFSVSLYLNISQIPRNS
ncbi:hypothetical protein Tco_0578433 [Tanacetum coccineum]